MTRRILTARQNANQTKPKKDKPERYKKVIIPAYGAAAASEKYVTDDSEDESGSPAPKAKKTKKVLRPPLIQQDRAAAVKIAAKK